MQTAVQIVCISKDEGNARAGAAVAQALVRLGATVTYLLDKRGSAWKAYTAPESTLAPLLQEMEVVGLDDESPRLWHDLAAATAIFVTLSASGAPNLEFSAFCGNRPVYGLEEVLFGRNNPVWVENDHAYIRKLRRLFTAFPTTVDNQFPNVTFAGPPQLDAYRGKNWDAMGAEARRKLGIAPDVSIVFYAGHPDPESPPVLYDLGKALHSLGDAANVVLVVARHGRELTKPVPDNSVVHRHALRLISQNAGVKVIENSLGHAKLASGDPDEIPKEFRPPEFATYQELVCACRSNGVVVIGFATDGFLAGFLGVPAILYLNPFLLGALAMREKKVDEFPLPMIPHARSVEDLSIAICRTFFSPALRARHIRELQATYPFPEQSPADRIAETILSDVAATA